MSDGVAADFDRHSHSQSWPETMDWLELRNHLVLVHLQPETDIDDASHYPDETTGRRNHAVELHGSLHDPEVRRS
jgi:hypothetical protein